jgi:hypothetical protein
MLTNILLYEIYALDYYQLFERYLKLEIVLIYHKFQHLLFPPTDRQSRLLDFMCMMLI